MLGTIPRAVNIRPQQGARTWRPGGEGAGTLRGPRGEDVDDERG